MTTDDANLELQRRGIDVIRALALDATNEAKSGHQGTAMALAPLAHVLFTRVLRYDAADPRWPDRDRFILSAGHASMLLYSMLYLTGQGLELKDLRQFRQWGSATPGHPEAGHTAGVEVTTGPLGQGFGNAVGMAVAEEHLRARYGSELCDHHTFVIAGDGDLSEGVSHEAASLAGHLGLGRLVVVYDDNRVTIDGPTDLALSDDAAARFAAYGWHVDELGPKGEDLDALETALLDAKSADDRPSLIIVRTEIGYPSPNFTGDPAAHGNPMDDTEIAATKERMGLPPNETFWVPDDVLAMYRTAGTRGAQVHQAWRQRLAGAGEDGQRWHDDWSGRGLDGIASVLPSFDAGESIATRKASQQCVSALASAVPGLVGGSADLTGNTGTEVDDVAHTADSPAGRQLYFGVREHAMAAATVGAARHGGVVPFCGTFLVFADYMRPAIRLAAMSRARCVFVWTHDSVGVGEDGPTHQPVEQVMSLRAIPDLQVIRPADATEVAGAWALALASDGPSALILTRQGVPVLADTDAQQVASGAYVLQPVDRPDVTLVGTGSEVAVCVDAATRLGEQGIQARVVSMPCWEAFQAQPAEARAAVVDPATPTVSVEAGVTLGWDRWADVSIGIDTFGASAPGGRVLRELGISADHVVAAATNLLEEGSEQ